MTKDNYSEMSNQELVDSVNKVPSDTTHLSRVLKKDYPELYNELVERTRFLNRYYEERTMSVPIPARLYCLKHNLKEQPRCQNPDCPNHSIVGWCTKTQEFHMYCSCACLQASPLTKSKRNNTFNSKYGGHPMKSTEIKEKAIRNNKAKHGGVHSSALPEVKAKVVATNLKKYNTSCSLQNEEVNAKARQSMLEHHGAEYPLQCTDIREKIRETLLKTKGVEHPSQSEEWKQKVKETNLRKRGVTCPLHDPKIESEIRKKIENTNQERYGDICATKSKQIRDKIRITVMSKEVQDRTRRTCRRNWGVDYYSQTYEYHKNRKHKFHSTKYPGLSFDSTWEVKVYEFCRDNNIPVEYSPSISYEYEYDGRTWTYHPDFLINGKVYEVKGEQFFRINESTGQEEMYKPYREAGQSLEEYNWVCGKEEAKHQCMIANGVTILRQADIEHLDSIFLKD